MLSFLYIFIHVFRFSFNKSSRIMNELNQNSYAVYIIHVIVLGLIALMLLNLHVPAFLKYFILTILTYVVSNAIVYAYRRTFQKMLSKNVITIAIPVAATLLTLTIYVKQANPSVELTTSSVSLPELSSPKVGLHMAAIQGNLEAIKQHIQAQDVHATSLPK